MRLDLSSKQISHNPEQKKSNNKTPLRLDLGCSYHKKDGYIGIDILKADGVNVVTDAQSMPFKTSIFDEVYSSYALEHIPDNLAVITELYRICKPDTLIRLILPHSTCPAFYDDLTHCHKYSSRTWEHYDQEMHELTGHPNYLPDVNFKLDSFELRWWPPQVIERKSGLKKIFLRFLNKFINSLANNNPFLCERLWCNWVGGFYEIEYVLRVIK